LRREMEGTLEGANAVNALTAAGSSTCAATCCVGWKGLRAAQRVSPSS